MPANCNNKFALLVTGMLPPFVKWDFLRLLLLSFLAASLFSLSSPVEAGTTLTSRTTLLRNREYAEALLEGIRNARKSVILSFYLFKVTGSRGNLPRKIAEELLNARKRGVDVTVILEKQSGDKDPLNEENRQTAAFLNRGGVKVFFDSPHVTTHTKTAIIDSRYVYLGSHNLTQSALRHNNELSVLIDSPEMAAEAKAYLDRL
ncbi:MAG: phospholipase [Geobacteraceae bacterium]|nr:MAG: phospholipase [Geobacteraceae bacterium]